MMGRVFFLFEDYYILMRAEKGRRVRQEGSWILEYT